MNGLITIDIKADKLKKVVDLFHERLNAAIERALVAVANELLRDSRMYVPVLTGALRNSGRVERVYFNDVLHIVRVVYGNALVRYAYYQHEKPLNHPGLGFTGAAKYLEKPLLQNMEFYDFLFMLHLRLELSR